MRPVTFDDVSQLVQVVHGTLDPDKLTLFSTMKDEMGFLPAWIAHHRAIGFEQFLIWDDQSTDGSVEWLSTQPDTVVMQSRLSFGEELRVTMPDGRRRKERAGTYFKMAVPQQFLAGRFVGYLDADEFLILPPGSSSIAEVVSRLTDLGETAIAASLVEFFPSGSEGLIGALPQDFDGLVAAYPWFQATPLIELRQGEMPRPVGPSKTALLYQAYSVQPPVVRKGLRRIWMPRAEKRRQLAQTSPRYKTPLIRRTAASWAVGSHNASVPPVPDHMLTVAHFVFAAHFREKIETAIRRGAHAHGARKYHGYRLLLERLDAAGPGGFLDDASKAFEGSAQFLECELMIWPQGPSNV